MGEGTQARYRGEDCSRVRGRSRSTWKRRSRSHTRGLLTSRRAIQIHVEKEVRISHEGFSNFSIWASALLYGAEGRFRSTHKGSCVAAKGILCGHSIYTYALLFCVEEVIVKIRTMLPEMVRSILFLRKMQRKQNVTENTVL